MGGGRVVLGWVERVITIVAGISVVAGVSVLVARSDVPRLKGSATVTLAQTASPEPKATSTTAPPPAPAKVVAEPVVKTKPAIGAVTTVANATLRTGPKLDAKGKGVVPPGILAAVLESKGSFYHVLTPGDRTGWFHASKVKTHKKASGKAKNLKDATIVIDPGHGGHLPGAVGKRGLTETSANVGISKRLVDRLDGTRVFMTNTGQHAGLRYRAVLANKLGAHAFVSVHNNALPDKFSKLPGTEVYYSQKPGSKRLAGLLYEELFKTLSVFKINWGRDPFPGAKYRLSQQHGGDYYAVLRRSSGPAVIVEAMFITNPPEEQLLREARVRQAIADALARGLKRYFNTDDLGSGFQDPYAKPTPNCPIPGCFEHRK